jgi:hypothetical protein
VSAAPQEERGASPPPSLLAPQVEPRGQLRRRRGRGGGRGGGGGREWESPLRRRGGPSLVTAQEFRFVRWKGYFAPYNALLASYF